MRRREIHISNCTRSQTFNEKDKGPNTGGMELILHPLLTQDYLNIIVQEIIEPQ